ncbi:dynein axonemal heavy chain 2-like, partial [Lampetra fluviatilis]
VSLLFEVEDLAAASPATVSRCAVVYSDYPPLGWRTHAHSWLQSRTKEEAEHLRPLLERYVQLTLDFVHATCRQPVPVSEWGAVSSLCKLYGALATLDNGVNPADVEGLGRMVELWFLFSVVWSLCAAVDEEGRKKVDNFLREIEGTFPNKDTVYDYYVDVKNRKWALFEEKLPKGWRYLPSTPFYKLLVPTVDTLRYHLLISALVSNKRPVLLVGPVGTGKTLLAQSVAQSLDPAAWSVLTINMSAQVRVAS